VTEQFLGPPRNPLEIQDRKKILCCCLPGWDVAEEKGIDASGFLPGSNDLILLKEPEIASQGTVNYFVSKVRK
jgi:hypothetical protein